MIVNVDHSFDFDRVFEQACAVAPDERPAYLARVCPHDDQREFILSLIDARSQAGSLWDDFSRGLTDLLAVDAPEPPPKIPGFRLLRLLGEGGMGRVYLVREETAPHRALAVKVLKEAMAERTKVRFDLESQALAAMDHPNLTRYIGTGETEDGRPWMAMSYFPGIPITEFCTHFKLDLDERLRLFEQILDGANHAHQRGVIHRDLKPANILAAFDGDRPHVKIIDFGIAKYRFLPGPETMPGSLVGTPLYMSPEQIDTMGRDVDIRADVYALGVLLYQLTTGVTPFSLERFRRATLEEMIQIIKHETPIPPERAFTESTVGSGPIPGSPGTASRFHEQWRRSLRRELGWIIAKAMAKNRKDRYQSVSEFADDLKALREHRPVRAGHHGPLYRVKKWARRRRSTAISLGVTAAALVLASCISLMSANRARHAAELARRETIKHEQTKNFLLSIITTAAPDVGGPTTRLLDVVNQAGANLDPDLPEDVLAEYHDSLGRTYRTMGVFDKARRHLNAAKRLKAHEDDDACTTHLELAFLRMDEGDYLGALQDFERMAKHLSGGELSRVRLGKANCLRRLARHDEAAIHYRALLEDEDPKVALAAMTGVANVAFDRKDYPRARELYETARQQQHMVLGPLAPQTLNTENSLAILLLMFGEFDAALATYRDHFRLRTAYLGPDHPHTLNARYGEAYALQSLEHHQSAATLYRDLLTRCRRVYGEGHQTTLDVTTNLSLVLNAAGETTEAIQLSRHNVELHRRHLGPTHVRTARARANHQYITGDSDPHIR